MIGGYLPPIMLLVWLVQCSLSCMFFFSLLFGHLLVLLSVHVPDLVVKHQPFYSLAIIANHKRICSTTYEPYYTMGLERTYNGNSSFLSCYWVVRE